MEVSRTGSYYSRTLGIWKEYEQIPFPVSLYVIEIFLWTQGTIVQEGVYIASKESAIILNVITADGMLFLLILM